MYAHRLSEGQHFEYERAKADVTSTQSLLSKVGVTAHNFYDIYRGAHVYSLLGTDAKLPLPLPEGCVDFDEFRERHSALLAQYRKHEAACEEVQSQITDFVSRNDDKEAGQLHSMRQVLDQGYQQRAAVMADFTKLFAETTPVRTFDYYAHVAPLMARHVRNIESLYRIREQHMGI